MIKKRDNFRFSAKEKKESGSESSGNISSFASCSLNNNMAGFNSKPTSSRSGSRRESLEGTNQARSFASNEGFMRLLMKLPEELIRQENEINRLKKELAQLSPSR